MTYWSLVVLTKLCLSKILSAFKNLLYQKPVALNFNVTLRQEKGKFGNQNN